MAPTMWKAKVDMAKNIAIKRAQIHRSTCRFHTDFIKMCLAAGLSIPVHKDLDKAAAICAGITYTK